jgi:hypothetical protein
VVIQLDTPPLLVPSVPPDGNRLEAMASLRESVFASVRALWPTATVDRTFEAVFAGFSLTLRSGMTPADLDRLRSLAGVRGVYADEQFQPTDGNALDVGAGQMVPAAAREAQPAAAGTGVRVAVIGDGILVDHPTLASTGLSYPAGYPKGDARYASPKVIAARVYLRPGATPWPGEETPLPGPHGGSSGTHYAATIAGVPTLATYRGFQTQVTGVAPNARLMNYRVFYPTTDGRQPTAYSSEIIAAVEDAVQDGAQVILVPWTSNGARSPVDSPVAQALANAVAAGCVLVAAAGDAGPAVGSVSRLPAALPEAITVGAVTAASTIRFDLVDVYDSTGPNAALSSRPFSRAQFGPVITQTLGPLPVVPVSTAATNGQPYACQALPTGSLAGAVALVARGDCSFAEKVDNAQRAGALAVLIYDDDETISEMGCADGALCLPGVLRIPAVMVAKSLGEGLMGLIQEDLNPQLSLVPIARQVATTPDVMLASSARGPGFGRYAKPDLLAPGESVLSAVTRVEADSGPYGLASGSGTAAANVAGQVALLVEKHPLWTPGEVRSALVQTARPDAVATAGASAKASVLAQGAGILQPTLALAAQLLYDPSLGALSGMFAGQRTILAISVHDVRSGGSARRWTVAVTASRGVAVSAPESVTLAPGQSTTLNLSVEVGASVAAGDWQARIALTSGSDVVRWPLWVRVLPQPQAAQVLVIDNDFSNFESYVNYAPYVTDALTATGYAWTLWNADERYDVAQSLPTLAVLNGYQAIIWFTGDNKHADGYYDLHTPLTEVDLTTLGAYLDGGGRLLALGQNLAEASDVNSDDNTTWGRGRFYHDYLGAHWLQGSLFGAEGSGTQPPQAGPAVIGQPGSFLQGVLLHLGPVGDGEGNQVSVDEIAPGGIVDGGDADLVQPILTALGGTASGKGWVGVAKGDEPTLEDERLACQYRTAYLSFGLEGINTMSDTTGRAELLKRIVTWLTDQVTVTLPTGTVGAPNTPLTVACLPVSSANSAFVGYRWRLSGPGLDRVIETTTPELTYSYQTGGQYSVTVQATDALGHSAVAHGTVEIVTAGASTLVASPAPLRTGGSVRYLLTIRNTQGTPLSASVRLPLPSGTSYQYHSAGQLANGVLQWSGTLPSDATYALELGAYLGWAVLPGTLVAEAELRTPAGLLILRSEDEVVVGCYLPLVEDWQR